MADDSVNPLVRQVQERLPWLFSEYGFKIIDYSYDRFGGCQVILSSEQLRISFVRGRSFSRATLAARSDPTKSYELDFLLLALQDTRPDIGFEGNAAVLKDNWTLLVNALGPELAETKQEYERREQVSREIFERHQRRRKVTPRGLIYKMKKTAAGRVLFLCLRVVEAALILWAIYTVFKTPAPH
jgi:hypothetical protein